MRQINDDEPYKIPYGDYQGTELKQDPSIRDERMHAFALPSRVGDRLYYRDGRCEAFPGTQGQA